MKTVNFFDKEIGITKEFDLAVCVIETRGTNLNDYSTIEIELGQKVYNFKILESGSVIFTLSQDSEDYIVTMFPQKFGFPTEMQLTEIKELEKTVKESLNKINEIYNSIQRTGYTEIP